eukprot:843643-Pelagomonas_calceolata.AAC.9
MNNKQTQKQGHTRGTCWATRWIKKKSADGAVPGPKTVVCFTFRIARMPQCNHVGKAITRTCLCQGGSAAPHAVQCSKQACCTSNALGHNPSPSTKLLQGGAKGNPRCCTSSALEKYPMRHSPF